MSNSRRSCPNDFEKILRLLFLNVYDRFYPLRGLVAVTAIGTTPELGEYEEQRSLKRPLGEI